MKKNNKGFSLVEMIIVIAIIAIVTSAAFFGFGYLSMADCKKCANRINSGLSTAKSKTMAEVDQMNMFLYRYNDDFYIKYDTSDTITKDGDAEKIGNGSISITTYSVSGTTTVLQNGSEPVKVTISRKDGSYKTAPQSFLVSSGDVSKTVYLVTETGKHFVE